MDKFITHKGIAAPLLRNNVDTDAIIPSREMKTVSKLGLGVGLFAPWRYLDEKARTPNPEFVLNKAEYSGATIIISGNNFGCGSSREHAVWALKEYGIRCIIAESYGSIFYRNCIANGILPIKLDKSVIKQIANENPIEIDLPAQTINAGQHTVSFDIADIEKNNLLEGLDPISETLKLKSTIDVFHTKDQRQRPWMHS